MNFDVKSQYKLGKLVGGMEDEYALVLCAQHMALLKGIELKVPVSKGVLGLKGEKCHRVKDLIFWAKNQTVNVNKEFLEQMSGDQSSNPLFYQVFAAPMKIVLFPGDEIEVSIAYKKASKSYKIVDKISGGTQSILPLDFSQSSILLTIKLAKLSPLRELALKES